MPEASSSQRASALHLPDALAADEAKRRYRALLLIVVAALVVLALVGGWAYAQVRKSLGEVRGAGLSALLEAETATMQIWIDEKKRDAERWALSPDVQRAAAALVRLSQRGMPPAEVCTSGPHQDFVDAIAPYAALEETVAFHIVGRDGVIVAAQQSAYCGRRVTRNDFLPRLQPVFEGRTTFIRPYRDRDRIEGDGPLLLTRPTVWVEAPVHDESGEVIASLGFGRYAEDRFGNLLNLPASAARREAFAFDRRGFMLTNSRHAEEFRAEGVLGPGETGILRVRLAPPASGSVADKPGLTLLAQAAISARESGETNLQGLVLTPYRNHRGTEVIGAWRWLAGKEMAIGVEIEAQEAYAPLAYMQAAFAALLAVGFAGLLAAGGSSVWAMRLRIREARRIGQYNIEREIGEGGVSFVYLARHERLKRPTAVKVLKPGLATDEAIARFEREAQLCSQLTHPNTIEIYDYGRTRDGRFYYAMEYLRGVSLEQLVPKDGPLPVSRAVHLLRQACGSLKEAHARGLVHRDVKPHNLMLCVRGGEYDVLKVLDFGLVKVVGGPHTRDLTQYAKVLGTPLYMAPERLRNPADADARADIYALGAVAFFLLTGRGVFEAASDHELVYQVLNVPASTLAERGAKGVPEVVERLVARCLAKDREARPASIGELEQVLEDIAREMPWREADARAWWHGRAHELGIEWDDAAAP